MPFRDVSRVEELDLLVCLVFREGKLKEIRFILRFCGLQIFADFYGGGEISISV